MHILDEVAGVHEEVAFIPNSREKEPFQEQEEEKGIGPEARKSLSCSGAFEITKTGEQ